jgi:hypothetical protein
MFMARKQWVDSIYNSMTFQERFGRLFIEAYSNKDKTHEDAIERINSGFKKLVDYFSFREGQLDSQN